MGLPLPLSPTKCILNLVTMTLQYDRTTGQTGVWEKQIWQNGRGVHGAGDLIEYSKLMKGL